MPDSAKPSAMTVDTSWLEAREERELALYATRSAGATRRHPEGDEGRHFHYRTSYQRDRDRIVHSRAFRRLRHKTQVFVPYEGDHYRNRLTHTLEVAQLGRTMARVLRLNEDLTEAIALGHDLGHTPFGHSGERVLSRLLGEESRRASDGGEVLELGDFKHNYQSVRVVDTLEKRYSHPGLNLTDACREGILKHTGWSLKFHFPGLETEGLHLERPCHLEGQLTYWADEIAQQTHDLEDGLRAELVPLAAIEALPISQIVLENVGAEYRRESDVYVRQAMLTRGLIHLLVTDMIVASQERIDAWVGALEIADPAQYAAAAPALEDGLIAFSSAVETRFAELKEFIYATIINSFVVSRNDGRARRVLEALFQAYHENPRLLPDYVLERAALGMGTPPLRQVKFKLVEREIERRYRHNRVFLRAITDHIAGMTDAFALKEFESIVTPRRDSV